MAMGMAVMMSVVVSMVVRMGVGHREMLYYNITTVQKRRGEASPHHGYFIQSFNFSENGGEQWRKMRGHGFPDIGSSHVVVLVPVKVANITNGPPRQMGMAIA